MKTLNSAKMDQNTREKKNFKKIHVWIYAMLSLSLEKLDIQMSQIISTFPYLLAICHPLLCGLTLSNVVERKQISEYNNVLE